MYHTPAFVLDTCALIWWSLDPQKLSLAAKQVCDEMAIEESDRSKDTSTVAKSF